MTVDQWITFNKLVDRWGRLPDYQGWGGVGSDAYYVVTYNNLYIGIEPDGYAHT